MELVNSEDTHPQLHVAVFHYMQLMETWQLLNYNKMGEYSVAVSLKSECDQEANF